jgi:shikimate kinase
MRDVLGGGPLAVLIGPPGAGKTTIAAAVAARLGLPVLDTDEYVERTSGRRVADIFVEDGEAGFRELENAAVMRALAEHDGVVSVGGGAVLDPCTQEALRGHTVVFLDVRITDAARRIGLNRDRPLLLGNPRAQWTMMMDARRPIYTQVATVRVVTDGLDVEGVTAAVLGELERLELLPEPDTGERR